MRYNAFSRKVAILANKIFGLPIVNYFGDLGCLRPISIEKMGLRAFRRFSAWIHFAIKDIKTKVGRKVTLLGLEGVISGPLERNASPHRLNG